MGDCLAFLTPPTLPAQPPIDDPSPQQVILTPMDTQNSLLKAASPLCTVMARLSLVVDVKTLKPTPSPSHTQTYTKLTRQLPQALTYFKATLLGADYPKSVLMATNHLLTSWAKQLGISSEFSDMPESANPSTLSDMLAIALKNPETYHDFLVLAYMAFSLGFAGADAATTHNDTPQQETYLDRLYQCIKGQVGAVSGALSPALLTTPQKPRRFSISISWVMGITLLLGLAIWAVPAYRVHQYAAQVNRQLV